MTRTMGRRGSRWLGVPAACLIASGFVLAGGPARACDCAAVDVEARLRSVDGAFVGTFVEREALSDRQAAYTFEVEQVLKGDFGSVAVVRSNADGASCGLEFLDGPRTGLLLDRASDGVWESGLCAQVSPATLLASARATHPPDPSIAATRPDADPPWWGFALVGLALAAWLALMLRRRRPGGA